MSAAATSLAPVGAHHGAEADVENHMAADGPGLQGPEDQLMSQDPTGLGPGATNSGLVRGGCGARRSRASLAMRNSG